MSEEAYFCLVTWPDGSEGLLFPRPGNVPVNKTLEDGSKDFDIAAKHLSEHVARHPEFVGTTVRLVKFARLEAVKEFKTAQAESFIASKQGPAMYTCKQCNRQMAHTHKWGYICEYCAGIED